MRQFPCRQAWGRKGGDMWNMRLEHLESALSVPNHPHVWSFTPSLYKLLIGSVMIHFRYEEAEISR